MQAPPSPFGLDLYGNHTSRLSARQTCQIIPIPLILSLSKDAREVCIRAVSVSGGRQRVCFDRLSMSG